MEYVRAHACMHVNKLREHENLKEWYGNYFFLTSKVFSVNILPWFSFQTRKEQRERSVLFEFRVRRKSNMLVLIIFAKAARGIWVRHSSLNRIALDGIPSCHCCRQARSGGSGCCGSPRLFHFPSYTFSYVLKLYVLVMLTGFQSIWKWAEFTKFVLIIWMKQKLISSKQCDALIILILIWILGGDSLRSFWLNQFMVKLAIFLINIYWAPIIFISAESC